MATKDKARFAGKVAFVTGAANGIGRATALAFAREGASVALADVSERGNQETARMIEDLGGRALALKCDVTRVHQIPLILEQGGGAIVNTSSGAGIIGIRGSPAYTASKHGLIGLTRAAALDYAAQNIRINVVCPGYIDTPMMNRFTGGTPEGRASVIAEEPVGRMGKPEEIAAAVVWLCSDAAAFVIGHAMVIDGGQTV
jgi:NAD(P)-dependent dehydrogenase (short-subunit alcohol dehydrogenase family)